MVRKFAIGDSVVYCGEAAPLACSVVGYLGFINDVAVYWLASAAGRFACSEGWLEVAAK